MKLFVIYQLPDYSTNLRVLTLVVVLVQQLSTFVSAGSNFRSVDVTSHNDDVIIGRTRRRRQFDWTVSEWSECLVRHRQPEVESLLTSGRHSLPSVTGDDCCRCYRVRNVTCSLISVDPSPAEDDDDDDKSSPSTAVIVLDVVPPFHCLQRSGRSSPPVSVEPCWPCSPPPSMSASVAGGATACSGGGSITGPWSDWGTCDGGGGGIGGRQRRGRCRTRNVLVEMPGEEPCEHLTEYEEKGEGSSVAGGGYEEGHVTAGVMMYRWNVGEWTGCRRTTISDLEHQVTS